ncbi:hypothetical protein [Deinococcus sp. YIM 77859]|uniref:hypothetical protein n=1 Tax=Deinococcus sp. YIM 77859 TaxID=1540221 RepID=UPI000A9CAC91|nr:hypothetical protein [Deinococcus sp. YIM 77859]
MGELLETITAVLGSNWLLTLNASTERGFSAQVVQVPRPPQKQRQREGMAVLAFSNLVQNGVTDVERQWGTEHRSHHRDTV